MYYSDELIEDIRVQNDIISVVSEYVQLKKRGNQYIGLCPFHNENTPSFSVSQEKQLYHCFGCGAGGNVYTFIMQIENYNFLEAVKYLADRVKIILPTPEISEEVKKKMQYREQLMLINRETAKYFYYQLYSTRGQVALQYLNGRKIKKNVYKKFGLGYSNISRNDLYQYLVSKNYKIDAVKQLGLIILEKNKLSYYDRFWNRLMFPIFDVHNKIIGFGGRVLGEGQPKYLNSPESNIYNKRKHLYGLNFARTTKRRKAIIVEGYMDVISLHQAGFDNAVASLGTAFTTEQAMLLRRYFTDVILAYDSDEAGIKAAVRTIPILERNGFEVRVLNIPEYKDPDEYIKNCGTSAFEKLIENAKTGVMFEIDLLRNKYSLNKPDEKIKFIMNVARRLISIDNKVEQDVYIKQIAQEVKISEASLREEMTKIIQNTGIVSIQENAKNNIVYNTKNNSEDGVAKIQKGLIAIILNHPYTYEVVKNYIKPQEFLDPIYRKVLEYIYAQYENGKVVQFANILNLFIEIDEQQKVSRIFNENYEFETLQQEEKAINELVKGIKQANIDYLSRNNKDLSQLQQLIKAKIQLQNLKISLNKA